MLTKSDLVYRDIPRYWYWNLNPDQIYEDTFSLKDILL
jgi:hypothetical protein